MSRSLRMLAAATVVALAACSNDSTGPRSPDAAVAIQTASTVLGAIPSAAGTVAVGIGMGVSATGMGPAPDATAACSWDATSGYWVCSPVTRNGVTVERRFAFFDANGTAQERPGPSTASMKSAMHVAGTLTTTFGTMTLDRRAANEVTGINTPRLTINGTEGGTSQGTLTIDTQTGPKQITTDETSSSVTKDLVVPAPPERGFPLSGTQSHTSTVKATVDGVAQTHTTAVTITFDGTSTAQIDITVDGMTRHCTMTLGQPGQLTCSR